MKEYSVAMALVDFIPVILFAAGAVILQRGLYSKMSKGAFALFAAGTIDVIFAGALKAAEGSDTLICAICAAPRVPGLLGLLAGHTATCYPGNEEYLKGAVTTTNETEVSGQFVTSRGAGTAIAFALQIIAILLGEEQAQKIRTSIIYQA